MNSSSVTSSTEQSPIIGVGIEPSQLNNEDLIIFESQTEITVPMTDEVIEGKNIFSYRRLNKTGGSVTDQNAAIVMDMQGNVEKSLVTKRKGLYFIDPKMINSTTALIRNSTLMFWNVETGALQELPIVAPSHDVEYNRITNSFLGKYWSDRDEYNGLPIRYNDLYEYDMEGNLLWYWNSTEYFPFDPAFGDGVVFQNTNVWMHANAIYWDIDNDAVYLNSKSLDTFYKIDKTKGEVEWGLGRLGDFTLYDKRGEQVDSLWYHGHGLEMIGDNRFIIFDNDNFNLTRMAQGGSSDEGTPRLVEIEINEDTMEAREVWSWAAPKEYYGRPWGDANRLPGGNTMGDFGWIRTPNWLTEVNPEGEIVWEAKFANTTDYEFGIYRAERYYLAPIVQTDSASTLDEGVDYQLSIITWNTIKERIGTDATLSITLNGNEIISDTFTFKKHWQATELDYSIAVSEFNIGANTLVLLIINSDGKFTVQSIQVQVGGKDKNDNTPVKGSIIGIVVFSSMVYLFRKRKHSGLK